MFRDVTDFGYV